MTLRRMPVSVRALAAPVVVLLALTGCATQSGSTDSPSASRSSTPTPTADAGPAVRLVIAADALRSEAADGTVVDEADYADGADALIALATTVLGAPSGTTPGGPGVTCETDPAATWWGSSDGVERFSVNTDPTAAGAIPATWVSTRIGSFGTGTISGAKGASIGAASAPLETALSADAKAEATGQVPEGGAETRAFVVDVAGTEGGRVYGESVVADAGSVLLVAAPRRTADVFCSPAS